MGHWSIPWFRRRPAVVLAVDDDLETLDLIRHAADTAGLQVETATTAEEALGILHSNGRRFVLAMLDVRLPVMDGWTLRQRIIDYWPTLPVVVMSGSPDSFYDIPHGERISVLIKPANFSSVFRNLK